MKSFNNRELRQLARQRLWTDHWFGRLLGGSLLFTFCAYFVNLLVGEMMVGLNVPSWGSYIQAVAMNRETMTTPIPNLTPNYTINATVATVFQMFIAYIMAGIVSYAHAVMRLKSVANETEGWLKASFGGFNQPFGVLWLLIRYALVFIGWIILPVLFTGLAAFVLSIESLGFGGALLISCLLTLCIAIPFYRYRFLWYVKAEHPDWGAGACLKACRNLMKGNLMKSVRLDCSYYRAFLLMILSYIIFIGIMVSVKFIPNVALQALLCLFSLCAIAFSSCVVAFYVSLGQTFLYRELTSSQEEMTPAE